MASTRFDIRKATTDDLEEIARAVIDGLCRHPLPQATFYAKAFGETDGSRNWVSTCLRKQMRHQPNSIFLNAVDKETNRIVGFAKWLAPNDTEDFWMPVADEMDAPLCKEFFGLMDENRETLMHGRRHWYLELLAVSSDYQRQGAGTALVAYGCQAADQDGVEAYVDGTPAGSPLYEKFGFVTKNQTAMPAPDEYFVLHYMVRPVMGGKLGRVQR